MKKATAKKLNSRLGEMKKMILIEIKNKSTERDFLTS